MKRRNQEGAIVIEATIALTTFMFLIVTILSIVNICLVQSRMGTLVHGVAKDISNYTYIYTMTGLNEREQAISAKADYSRNTLEEVKNNGSTAFDAIQSLGKAAQDETFWSSMMSLLAEGGIQEGKAFVVDKICKQVAEKRLNTKNKSADAYLKSMGIEEGVEGLDFTDSSFCAGGGDDITIVISYKVHVLELLGVDFDFQFEQCAATKSWCAATGSSQGTDTGDTGNASKEPGNESDNADKDDEESEDTQKDEEEEAKKDENVEEKEKTKSIEDYVNDSTYNDSSPQVMLGKSTGNAETDYETLAKKYDMTYLKLNEKDKASLGNSDDLWNVHKKFLEEQHFKGKQFILSSNPYHAAGTYEREVDWLLNKGYSFEYDPVIGVWKAEK